MSPSALRRRSTPRLAAVLAWTALAATSLVLVAGCGGDSEAVLPEVSRPAVSGLTAEQIVTEAQRALSQASSVHITGTYRENNKPVTIDMRIAQDDMATGIVISNGSNVEVRRIGDQLFVRGDDKFLAALGPEAVKTKGKWLVGPIAQADRGLANLTDLQRFAGTLSPGKGALVKEAVRPLAGTPAVSVRSSTGARLFVADTGPTNPLRVERTGPISGFVDYRDYNAPVVVTAPAPTVPLASVTGG